MSCTRVVTAVVQDAPSEARAFCDKPDTAGVTVTLLLTADNASDTVTPADQAPELHHADGSHRKHDSTAPVSRTVPWTGVPPAVLDHR